MTSPSITAPVLLADASPLGSADAIANLVSRLKSKDSQVRGSAWQKAGTAGSEAVKPLVGLLEDEDFETARSAKRALYKIIRHAGRPGAVHEAKAVASALIPFLNSASLPVRREILWMLSEIGNEDAIAPMAALLAVAEIREDARCALMRLPFADAAAALRHAMASAPKEFQFALAESLRQLGCKVDGNPSHKFADKRDTQVGK